MPVFLISALKGPSLVKRDLNVLLKTLPLVLNSTLMTIVELILWLRGFCSTFVNSLISWILILSVLSAVNLMPFLLHCCCNVFSIIKRLLCDSLTSVAAPSPFVISIRYCAIRWSWLPIPQSALFVNGREDWFAAS